MAAQAYYFVSGDGGTTAGAAAESAFTPWVMNRRRYSPFTVMVRFVFACRGSQRPVDTVPPCTESPHASWSFS